MKSAAETAQTVHGPNSSITAAADAPAAARTVLKLLEHLQHGSLCIECPDGSTLNFGNAPGFTAKLQLRNWHVFQASLKSGDIGFAESFIDKDWTTPDLTTLLMLVIANRKVLDGVIFGSWLGRLIYRIRHLLNRNNKRNSRKNIHAHYDLGNSFYKLWLDPSMNYSSAYFEDNRSASLEEAQMAKVRRALRMVKINAGERVLEIGCGWGALAQTAIEEFGAHVTGVTLSSEQLSWAQARLSPLQTRSRADLRLQDYRDINDGPYDAICSIEMFEAVGQAYWPTYFEHLVRLIKPGGRICIQTIMIQDQLFDRYIQSTDFIQQYIFPGGCLPCPREFKRLAKEFGLKIIDVLNFGSDYAETCRRWRAEFLAKTQEIQSLNFDARFMRIWEFYLSYCEAAFESGDIHVAQYTLER